MRGGVCDVREGVVRRAVPWEVNQWITHNAASSGYSTASSSSSACSYLRPFKVWILNSELHGRSETGSMVSSRDDVIPWWVSWLHGFPHLSFRFNFISNTFAPQDDGYRQALMIFLALAGACLACHLLVLLLSTCCQLRHKPSGPTKNPCAAHVMAISALLCCVAMAVGFYGNAEMNDGLEEVSESLGKMNHSLSSVDMLVQTVVTLLDKVPKAVRNISSYPEIQSKLIKATEQVEEFENMLKTLSFTPRAGEASEAIAKAVKMLNEAEFYRWLVYLLLLSIGVGMSMLALLGLAKHSKTILMWVFGLGLVIIVVEWGSLGIQLSSAVAASDFCIDPHAYITNVTQRAGLVSKNMVSYYVECPRRPTVLQDLLHKPNTTIISGPIPSIQNLSRKLLAFLNEIENVQTTSHMSSAVRLIVQEIQKDLSLSFTRVHELNALLDCHILHKDYVEALNAFCYDGITGLLWLCLSSLLALLSFTALVTVMPHVWRTFKCRGWQQQNVEDGDPFNPHMGWQARRRNPQPFPLQSGSLRSLESQRMSLQSPQFSQNRQIMGLEDSPLLRRHSPPPSYALAIKRFSEGSTLERESIHRTFQG
uniref:Protein tweety homolog n=1 Tax=Eptatretus burgeri TaxID=7764 RepID=A0A8C4Q1C5_EPTBU